MSAHTPGPWELVTTYGMQGLIRARDSWPVASVTGYFNSYGQTEANARLISAAPELLALAQAVVDNLILSGMEIGEQARAAIAKATGDAA